ncbi:uncharacterized protein METZ01_LOCUS207943, partial [marine metagenome]
RGRHAAGDPQTSASARHRHRRIDRAVRARQHRRGHWQKQGALLRHRAGGNSRRKILHDARSRRVLRPQVPPQTPRQV